MRTGASAAVSAKWLARKDSKVLAIVGAGHMAEGTLETCNTVFDWDEVRVWSRSQSTLDAFAAKYDGRFAFSLKPSTDLESVVRGADVVVTITPARGPIVIDEWISPGTHITAVGADKGGDQELDPRILQRARIFVDDIRQCRTDGEINVPLSDGLISESDIACEIGQVVAGKLEGRTTDDQIERRQYRCECGVASCFERIALTPEEYEAVRSHPARFLVSPGHEDLTAGEVVIEESVATASSRSSARSARSSSAAIREPEN